MRLLNVHTLEFKYFIAGAGAPRYAVASHRWGPDEATLKDVLKRRNVETQGFKKVEAFCAFVRQWDAAIEWLWVDTCCIDKRSSAEEAEAINSMYQYYSRAEVCVAWLGDVGPMEGFDGKKGELMRAFEGSVWWTRGWTLQELLAPTTVVFTTSAWEVIGYKTQAAALRGDTSFGPKYGQPLNDEVARITGIPEDVLWDFAHSRTLSVQERMDWMSKRTTTKIEDMAYCLLGIFGVHMTMIYGEGEAATLRLLEEIRRREAGYGSIAGSVWGDDTKSVAPRSVMGDRRDDSPPPPMPPPRRAATMQPRSTKMLPPPMPRSAPPMPPGLGDRVNAWRENTVEPPPEKSDEFYDFDDGDDTETLVSWNRAPSPTLTNYSAPSASRTTSLPTTNAGAFHSNNLQDLSDTLPPPYPGQAPQYTPSPYHEAQDPSPGISRSQTMAPPSSIGSSTMTPAKYDLKSKRLLKRINDKQSERARLETPRDAYPPPREAYQHPPPFGPPARSQTFSSSRGGDDDLEPSDSASSIGASSHSHSQPRPDTRGGLLRLLSDERTRRAAGSSSVSSNSLPQHQSPYGEDQDPQQGLQTFAGGALDVLSTLGSEVVSGRKMLKKMLHEEKHALRDARKAKRRGE